MNDDLYLNVSLLKKRVPNLTVAAKSFGLRPATVSNLTTGKVPIGKAEVKTLVALAEMAECKLDELIIKGNGTERIETGIKVIDLFAPLARGGNIGLVARSGMGQLVLLGEIFYRLKNQQFITLFLKPDKEVSGFEDVEPFTDIGSSQIEDLYKYITDNKNKNEIAVGIDRSTVQNGDYFEIKNELKKLTARPVTFLIVDTLGEAPDEDSPYGPLETLWHFDMDLVSRQMFPAIHSVFSTSTVLEGQHGDLMHFNVQQQARKWLRRYKELRFIVQSWGKDKLSKEDGLIYDRGEKLEAYFTQPFFTTENYTKKKGEWVPLQDTVEQVRLILEGALDEIPAEKLMFIGKYK